MFTGHLEQMKKEKDKFGNKGWRCCMLGIALFIDFLFWFQQQQVSLNGEWFWMLEKEPAIHLAILE